MKTELNMKIEEIENLRTNWNGYGSPSIPASVIAIAKEYVERLNQEPNPIFEKVHIFPTARESIQFEIEKNEKYIELELFETTSVVYYEIDGIEEEKTFANTSDMLGILYFINELNKSFTLK